MASIYPIILDDGSEPDTGSDVVTPVSQGTSATDVNLTPEHNGDQVGNNGAGTFAWDCQDLTELVSYLEGVRQTAAEAVGPLAITQPEIMHVRLGPDLGYDVVTTVPQGTQATIIGIGPQNEWYQVDLDELNIPGWIFQDMTELDGSLEGVRQVTAEEIAQLPISGAAGSRPLAVTQPEIMNVRLGPGLDYDVVTTVPHGTEAKILGIDPSRQWLQIELDGLEPLGWVYRDMIQVDCPLANVRRITEQEIAVLPAAIIQPRVVHARSGPGADYDVITILTKGTWAKIIAIGPQEKWFQVEVVGLDVPVWVDRCLTKVAGGSLASVRRYTTAEITPPPAEGSEDGKPLAVTLPITLNVRLGPGLDHDVVTVVPQGTQGRIYGMDPSQRWFLVELDGSNTLTWIYRFMAQVEGSLVGVRRVTAQEITAQPAALIQPRAVFAQSGPGMEYDAVTILPKGTWAKITGRDAQGDWIQIEVVGMDAPVWVACKLIKVIGSLAGVPQIAPGQ